MTQQMLVLGSVIVGWFKKLGDDERGASLVEYALLLALIAVVAIGALLFLGNSTANTLNNVGQHLVNS